MHGDNASGNSFNLVIIQKSGTQTKGPIFPDFCKRQNPIELNYQSKKGKTIVLKEKTIKFDVIEEYEEKRMEVD